MIESNNYYNYSRPEVAVFVPNTVKTILDVGCGQGAFLKLIKEQLGAETWGIELVKKVALGSVNKADNLLFGKVEDLLNEIPDDYFDCITFNDVLEHLLEPKDVLKMINPKLSPYGIIIASIPNVRFFDNLYEIIIKRDWEYKDAGILDSTHLRFFTKKSAKRMFEEAGYEVVQLVGINKKVSWKFWLFNFFTFGFFEDTKFNQFIFVAKIK